MSLAAYASETNNSNLVASRLPSRAAGISGLAEGRHIFGRRPKPREKAFRAGHYKDLTETGNRARKVSGHPGYVKAYLKGKDLTYG